MAKVVVTGGAGFIGSHLVDALVLRGDDVHVLDTAKVQSDRVNPKAQYHRWDIIGWLYDDGRTDYNFGDLFENVECIFHIAALPRVQFSIDDPTTSHNVNLNGTLAMLELARKFRVKRFVLASSSSVYGDSQKLPLVEDQPLHPMSPYAAQKLMSEVLCQTYHRTYGMETVCLRYFNVYGPRLDPKGPYALVIGVFLRQWLAGEPLTITGNGTQTRDFTHVSDVAQATMLAGFVDTVGKGEVINIGAGHEVSINELANMFSDSLEYIAPRPEPYRTRADNRLAEKLLGWRPTVRLEDGIDELKRLAQS